MSEKIDFYIFCLENYKTFKHLTGKQTFNLFNQFQVFDYLNEFYDVLHTTGHNYLNNDIDNYLNQRNAFIK